MLGQTHILHNYTLEASVVTINYSDYLKAISTAILFPIDFSQMLVNNISYSWMLQVTSYPQGLLILFSYYSLVMISASWIHDGVYEYNSARED